MKKTFLESLPRGRIGVDWINSVGYDVPFVYEDVKGIIKIIGYNKENQNLTVLYDSKIKVINSNSFKNTNLANIIGKQTADFKIELGAILKDDNRNITISDREHLYDSKGHKWKYYKYKCNNCGWEFGIITEPNLIKGKGCSCCAGRTVVEGINDIPTTAPWMVKYFQGGYDEAKLYTRGSQKSILPICPDCGRIKYKKTRIHSIYNNHSIGCICGDGISYPNKFIFNLVEQCKNQLDTYRREYRPVWTGGKIYDIYFKLRNGNEYIVEMDGNLGHGNTILPKSNVTKQESLDIDKMKDELAKKQGINIIRIDSIKSDLEYIKYNILNSNINNILDLTNVDWMECNKFAISNLAKEICTIYNNNMSLSTGDIADIVGVHLGTVYKHLINGTKIGWCSYSSDKAICDNRTKIWENNRKKVICLTTNKIFDSAIEGAKYYGLKSSSGISECCNKKSKSSGKLEDGTRLHWMYYD